jgi:hypothetical protein
VPRRFAAASWPPMCAVLPLDTVCTRFALCRARIDCSPRILCSDASASSDDSNILIGNPCTLTSAVREGIVFSSSSHAISAGWLSICNVSNHAWPVHARKYNPDTFAVPARAHTHSCPRTPCTATAASGARTFLPRRNLSICSFSFRVGKKSCPRNFCSRF